MIAVDDAMPGDVITFNRARFEGAGHDGLRYTVTAGDPRHVAVVVKVSGRMLSVLESNVGGKKTVQSGKYNLEELKSGSFQIFRAAEPLQKLS